MTKSMTKSPQSWIERLVESRHCNGNTVHNIYIYMHVCICKLYIYAHLYYTYIYIYICILYIYIYDSHKTSHHVSILETRLNLIIICDYLNVFVCLATVPTVSGSVASKATSSWSRSERDSMVTSKHEILMYLQFILGG